jgi:hypothetical protein
MIVNSLYVSPGIQPSIYKKYLKDPEILQKNTDGFKTGEGVENLCTAQIYWSDIHAGSSNKHVDGRLELIKQTVLLLPGVYIPRFKILI